MKHARAKLLAYYVLKLVESVQIAIVIQEINFQADDNLIVKQFHVIILIYATIVLQLQITLALIALVLPN